MPPASEWLSFASQLLRVPGLDILLDFSAMPITTEDERHLAPAFVRAFDEMRALESGAMANRDEGRRVGHYWLRAPELAPEPEIAAAITQARERVKDFAQRVRRGEIGPRSGERFERVLLIGIGGSALGPQLAHDAFGASREGLKLDFFDNTDPAGFEQVFERLAEKLARTLVVVTSKSGGTPETRNGLEEVRARLLAAGYEPAKQLVAVTGESSQLAERARDEGWVATFPMWDWIGGRTSECSAVGLLPLALAGRDVDALLEGARLMDDATRREDLARNPAARLALAWHVACGGRGERNMVVIPYRDRLALWGRYLQQLVMESLGKERDRSGELVRQGLTVYGNKGSTDQHAYVQQLREGVDNYFLTLLASMEDPPGPPLEVEPGITSGDYLLGFLLGTRRALCDDGRRVITLVIPRVDERILGALIALFERTVGFYASLIDINAYHQPGVEAGKQAAASVLALQGALLEEMRRVGGARSAEDWARRVGREELAVEAFWLLEHLAVNAARGVRREGEPLDPMARYALL